MHGGADARAAVNLTLAKRPNRLQVFHGVASLLSFGLWQRHKTILRERTIFTDHFVAHEELCVLLEARNDARMSLLHVEEERTRYRIFASCDGLNRWLNSAHRRNLQLVSVVLIERQAENAEGGLVRLKASKRLGIVAIDV